MPSPGSHLQFLGGLFSESIVYELQRSGSGGWKLELGSAWRLACEAGNCELSVCLSAVDSGTKWIPRTKPGELHVSRSLLECEESICEEPS